MNGDDDKCPRPEFFLARSTMAPSAIRRQRRLQVLHAHHSASFEGSASPDDLDDPSFAFRQRELPLEVTKQSSFFSVNCKVSNGKHLGGKPEGSISKPNSPPLKSDTGRLLSTPSSRPDPVRPNRRRRCHLRGPSGDAASGMHLNGRKLYWSVFEVRRSMHHTSCTSCAEHE